MADAEGEDAFRRHQLVSRAAGVAHEHTTVVVHVAALWHFQCRPKAESAAGGLLIGAADDHVTAERVVLKHPIKGVVQLFLRHLPGDECAFCEIACDQSLADTANRAGDEHELNALQDSLQRHAALFCDRDERFAHEPLNLVLGNREDLRVYGVGVLGD